MAHFDQLENRSEPCTKALQTDALAVADLIVELNSGRFADIAEPSRRAQDQDDGGGPVTLRRDGYM